MKLKAFALAIATIICLWLQLTATPLPATACTVDTYGPTGVGTFNQCR